MPPVEANTEPVLTDQAPVPVSTPPAPVKTKPKWLFGALAALLVLIIAGGAYGYFGVYLQKPENLWRDSLQTTRAGLQAYIDKTPSDKKA